MFIVSKEANQRQSEKLPSRGLSSITFHDISTSNRIGFRGANAEAFLEQHDIATPAKPNTAIWMPCGLLVMRLSHNEFWVIDALCQHPDTLTALEVASQRTVHNTRLYCQHSHALFALSGDDCPDMFAKVCGVDLQPDAFEHCDIVQTSIARVSSIVVNVPMPEFKVTRFFVFSDIASAAYLWEALVDAGAEYTSK